MRARRLVAPAALAVALVSFGLNLYLLAQLRAPERWAAPALERALRPLRGADGVITHTVRIAAGTPLSLDIPVDESFPISVDTVIPVNTTVRVPIDTPFGRRAVTIPIRADVPLRGTLPLRLRHTFELRTRTTHDIEVPVQIRIGDLLDRPVGGS